MHAKPDLRVVLKWMIAGSGPVTADVLCLKRSAALAQAALKVSDDVNVRLINTLSEFDLTLAEYAILHLVHYEPRRAEDAPGYARGLLAHTSIPLPTVADCYAAIESLCRRGFTAIIDKARQDQIIQYLGQLDCYGPTDGIPYIGQLDYTPVGADLWRNILNSEHPEFDTDYFWRTCVCFIYRTNATIIMSFDAEMAIRESRTCELVPISDPEPIGRWRSQWWREMPHGFRLRCLPDRD